MVQIRQLGLSPYLEIYQAMLNFTLGRNASTDDEIWLVEHPATFTQGRVGDPAHLLQQTAIPVINTDRGGQITYHGPGQLIMYVMIDLKRRSLTIRQLVMMLESSVIKTLAQLNIQSQTKIGAPGVYVEDKKICSLGLHIKRGRTLHGLALNIDMDLTPFNYINPCGYPGLKMTQISELTNHYNYNNICQQLVCEFTNQLNPIQVSTNE